MKGRPSEAIPELEFECVGGRMDGEKVTLHNVKPIFLDGELAGYLADDEPMPTDEGAYVVTADLLLMWTLRPE